MESTFKAMRVHEEQGETECRVDRLTLSDLSEGDLVVEVKYSGINYKDALAGSGAGKIMRRLPMVGGIDFAGTVQSSEDPRYRPGQSVAVTGCGLSETHDGGFAEIARVPGDWVVPLPAGLDARAAMILGTAGFTAALAVVRMEDNGQSPHHGPILVTGATGGVGSLAISMLAGLDYEVVALTGKPSEAAYLKALGAAEVLDRNTLELGTRPLEKGLWGGAVDNLGGEVLAWLTRTVKPWGNIASIGLAASHKLETTVMPFILRAVCLLGINSVDTPRSLRLATWSRIAGDLKPRHLDRIGSTTIEFDQLPDYFQRYLDGSVVGRVVVHIAGD